MVMIPTKDVIIKNRTEEDLKDIYLSYEGLEKHPFKISKISKNGQVLKSLCLNHLTKPTDLVLLYYVNDVKEEVVVYENMTYNDLNKLTVIISKNGDKLNVETTIGENNI